jgi:hypothetical protein
MSPARWRNGGCSSSTPGPAERIRLSGCSARWSGTRRRRRDGMPVCGARAVDRRGRTASVGSRAGGRGIDETGQELACRVVTWTASFRLADVGRSREAPAAPRLRQLTTSATTTMSSRAAGPAGAVLAAGLLLPLAWFGSRTGWPGRCGPHALQGTSCDAARSRSGPGPGSRLSNSSRRNCVPLESNSIRAARGAPT